MPDPTALDLTSAEVDVYRELTDRAGTAAQLAARLRIGDDRVRTALRGLRRLDLVVRSSGRPAVFSAVAPAIGLGGLVLRRERKLEELRRLQTELQERHSRAVRGAEPTELLEVVGGTDGIARRAAQLMRSARHEVRFVDKPPYAEPPSILHPVERDLLDRGVRFRGVYDRDGLEMHGLEEDLEPGLALGEQARVVADAPLKMILVDRHSALIPLDSSAPDVRTALVVRPCTLLHALELLFENLWREALPLSLIDGEDLSAVDMRLLGLLTTGMPDRTIAKQLGLSYRTFQRRLHDLMEALGAQTRFQAGLRAAAKGWVRLSVPD
ncbi:LuxR family transcriptional regulator [Saccharothrix violaceirubra]|uniref:DNA-binding NarL/FixJ family response regulator n=1 Tax=Saccharothrix violaceirubra TaxID=413306 RepID=A0A7W7T5L6_9PSEU|nr:helix-turn-helix domain-containing protein [Saccharothrix violaceirubra]MBB4966716.1 DNA-binding NarL/FixJ family response regulator [Saccharothrix violaceirubra]